MVLLGLVFSAGGQARKKLWTKRDMKSMQYKKNILWLWNLQV